MKQQELFNFPEIEIKNPIRLIELFGGIGAQAKALKNIGANFEHYKLVEINKYAVASYNAVHKTEFKAQDITELTGEDLKIKNTKEYDYIMRYSFPCQDLSIGGKQLGMQEESGTRSSLLWEVARLLNETKDLPQTLMMENVPQVHGEKNIQEFNRWKQLLSDFGYHNFYADLNAEDYTIPQSRNRCFMISTLYDGLYTFPEPVKLKKRMYDFLEKQVDSKYFISDKMFNYVFNIFKECPGCGFSDSVDRSYINAEVANTIGCWNARYQRSGIMNFVDVSTDQPILVKDMKKVLKIMKLNKGQSGDVYSSLGLAPTLTAGSHGYGMGYAFHKNKIRKLTPLECWRLMGFDDKDFMAAQKVCARTRLYEQAGNSIVVPVLEAIFRNMNIKGVKTWEEINKEEKYVI